MKTIELGRMGLMPLSKAEILETDGGKGWFSKLMRKISIAGVAYEIIQNWDAIKKGLSNGWNFDQPKK